MTTRASFADAHELADGFVEKAMEVVVRDEIVKIRYFIGMNDNTQADLKSKWIAQMSRQTRQSYPEDFEPILLQQVKSGIAVSREGTRVALEAGKVCQSPKQHFTYVVEFSFKIPTGRLSELEIEDKNFQEMDSAARYSFKALGSTMLVKSNVAPIIIRAQRHELQRLEERKRSEVERKRSEICKIRATVATDTGDSS